MNRHLVFWLAFVLVVSGCGKRGEILPPLVRIPQAPQMLSLVQQGGQAVLEWQNPEAYQDGSPMPVLARIEVWGVDQEAGTAAGPQGLSLEEFERKAVLQAVIQPSEFDKLRIAEGGQLKTLRFGLPLRPEAFQGRALSYALRTMDSRRKKSPFSEVRDLRPKPLPRPPFNLKTEVEADKIVLCWEPPAESIDGSTLSQVAGYRIFRAEKGAPFRLISETPVKELCFNDSQFVFGQTYVYVVRAAAADETPYDESDDSRRLEVTPQDTFPPEPPTGLTALPGEDFISLAWEPRPEKDLAGYRVWRREEGRAEFKELDLQLLMETTFLDRTAEKDKRYEYAVTAEDTSGNRSPFSAGVIESLKAARFF